MVTKPNFEVIVFISFIHGGSSLYAEEAIILAAGLGTRMSDYIRDVPKPLVKILDVPLIMYAIAGFLNIGVRNFYIVVNQYNLKAISNIMGSLNVNVKLIVNNSPIRGNGYSLILGMKHVKNELFYISMSDHIYAPSIFKKLLYNADASIIVTVDSNPRYINIDEATKVMTQHGKVIDIGKEINEYTHVDIGLFIMKKKLYNDFKLFSENNYKIELSKLIKYSINKKHIVTALDIHGAPWMDVDTANDLIRATNLAQSFIEDVKKIITSSSK
ncbi:MAG: hypothetical protein DRJ21_01540 [Candidatus Methanomethylicota archaeon]|uniref:Nucleotidyl transferase domain-containing protein n=1 Tax=Thermoproteota archaeon TaxID=2056631 RepID=A0A497EUJ5_9CREN|nr:MAG: hypothetical protein DRJ21_01540 [Candidatus Verstraetearchaeota archaeon]